MNLKQSITDYLVIKYQPQAILLHGSRARGLNRPNSDWDLYVFVDHEVKDGGSELWQGESLDIHILKLPISPQNFQETFLGTLQVTETLYEIDQSLQSLLEEAKRIYAAPYDLSLARRLRRKNYVHRLLLRLEGYLDQPELFFYYLGSFYENLFPYWYELKGKWSQPLYVAWPQIRAEDSEYAAQMSFLVSNATAKQKLDVAKQLYQKLFPA